MNKNKLENMDKRDSKEKTRTEIGKRKENRKPINQRLKQECKDKIQRLRIMKSKNQTIDREVTGTKTRPPLA